MKTINVIIFFLLFSTFSYGADYYFSTAGNDSNTGSESFPWQTLAKLNATSINAGDNIYFKRGDTWIIGENEYGIEIDFSGTELSPCTISSYGTGLKPVIDASAQIGDGVRGNGATEVCIYFNGNRGAYVTLDGLSLKAALNEYCVDAYNGTGGHSIITNCEMTGSGWSSQGLARFDGNCNTVSYCIFDSGDKEFAIGLEISGSSIDGDFNTVKNCTFIHLAAQGGAIRFVHMDRAMIENNWVNGANPNAPVNSQDDYNHWALVVRDPYNHSLPGGDYNTVRNNLIDLSNTQVSDCSGNDDCNFGLNTWNSTGADGTVPLKIFNNTIIGNGYGSGLKLQGGGSEHDQMIEVRNNIFYHFDIGIEVENSITVNNSVLISNNNYCLSNKYFTSENLSGGINPPGTQTTNEGSEQNGDPLLVNVSPEHVSDFKIQTESPCIDAGTSDSGDLQIPLIDFKGAARSDIDIGAYEYSNLPNLDFDLNNDGYVNVQDVVRCVNIILRTENGNADVNHDEQINHEDVVSIVNEILDLTDL